MIVAVGIIEIVHAPVVETILASFRNPCPIFLVELSSEPCSGQFFFDDCGFAHTPMISLSDPYVNT